MAIESALSDIAEYFDYGGTSSFLLSGDVLGHNIRYETIINGAEYDIIFIALPAFDLISEEDIDEAEIIKGVRVRTWFGDEDDYLVDDVGFVTTGITENDSFNTVVSKLKSAIRKLIRTGIGASRREYARRLYKSIY